MAGIRMMPEEPELPQGAPPRPQLPPAVAGGAGSGEIASDDERSVAADSWSVRSEYGSTLDDEQRHADAAEVLAAASNFPSASSDYCSDKDDQDSVEVEGSMLGLQSYWDASYSEELANFHEHGHAGEIWFGADVMDIVATWTKNLYASLIQGGTPSATTTLNLKLMKSYFPTALCLISELGMAFFCKQLPSGVDDILETKLDRKFKLVMDKGTLDAVGLHPDGRVKRIVYWESVSNLVEPGGIVVITSCNSTKDELLQEVEDFNKRKCLTKDINDGAGNEPLIFRYLDHVKTYPTFMFGGVEGSQVCTVAFLRV